MMASLHLPLRSYEMVWLIMCGLSMTSTGQRCEIGSSEVRVFATIHDDNSHSENSQSDPVLVETGSNVTLTCHGAQKSEIDWHFNSTFLGVPKCKNVKTCNLTLRWPFARGNYTCYVNDGDNCFIKVLELKDGRKPTIIKAPVNQSAHIGSNVTFNCTVSGDPAPAVNWTKDGNLLPFYQKVLRNLTTGESQLVIRGVRMNDTGKYRCVASNSMGTEKSRAAALLVLDDQIPTNQPVTGNEEPSSSTTLIVGLCLGVLALVTCVVIGLLRYRRSRPAKETNDLESSSLAMERLNEDSEISPDDTENISGITDAVREEDRVQLLAGHATEIASVSRQPDGEFSVDLARSQLETPESILTPGDVPPEGAPKPCRLMTQDSAYDSGGSQESVSLEHDNAFDGESVILKEHEESWEIDMTRLKVSDFVLGEGEFGVVKRGTYRGLDGRTCNVAVKQLKDGTSITDKDDLLGEIQMLKQAGWHPNIVALIGACTQEEEILVVTELIPNGSLEKFLKSKRMVGVPGEASTYENVHFGLNDRELLVIAYQIALGMQHLEEKKCIHRDLSARNVFIGENLVAKVGDFGLARDISFDGIYTKTSSGKVPWRWMALESLKDRVYTSKSDVWSYGIVLWEIATYGEVPYPNITILADLISWLSMGNRMSRPEHSSDELYEMMRLCWLENPLMRPTFSEITERFHYYLREYKRNYVNVTDGGLEKDPEVSLMDGISLTKTTTF